MLPMAVTAMTSSNIEEWRDIPGYEGRYQASNLGRIRSLDRRVPCAHGATRLTKGRVLRAAGSKYNPHLMVVLGHGRNGSAVHQLVASAFLGPQPKGWDVRHLDGNPLNNHVSNLAYGTRTENILDVLRIGRPWRKLTTADVFDIRARLKLGERGVDLAREYGVKEGCISAIKTGRSFKWLK